MEFDYFVLLAEMRTGSNFLESNLNAFPSLACVGEAFNPHFIGYPNTSDLLGVTLQQRELDPARLLERMKSQEKLTGFRYFHDHDSRILEDVLRDERCAKIFLTRDPLESYVSWKIAVETGQWKLTNARKRKDAKVTFDAEEFARMNSEIQSFRAAAHSVLQRTGQTAFHIGYEDLHDLEKLNGLARFLGDEHQLEQLSQNLKKQNPSALEEKVANPSEMARAMAKLRGADLSLAPDFEPSRKPKVGSYFASPVAPLVYLPIPSGPNARVKEWLFGFGEEPLVTGFNQKALRQWKRRMVGHRSFTVLRHPALRAHRTYCDRILIPGPRCFVKIRNYLERVHGFALPDDPLTGAYDRVAHRDGFLAFLEFVKLNLSGQTTLRVDGTWATQAAVLQGMAGFALPDLVFREDTLETDLEYLAFRVGAENAMLPPAEQDKPFDLTEIYDDEIEAAVRAAYQRDYMMFGFGAWGDAR